MERHKVPLATSTTEKTAIGQGNSDGYTCVIKAPSCVPNPPRHVKIEIRRSTTATSATRSGKTTNPFETFVAQSHPMYVNVRCVWTPAFGNGHSVRKYSVRRRLKLLITTKSSLMQKDISVSESSDNFLLPLNSNKWEVVAEEVNASHKDVNCQDHIARGFHLEDHIQRVRYYAYLFSRGSNSEIPHHSDMNMETHMDGSICIDDPILFLSPGCAYTDTIAELDILLEAASDKGALVHLRDALRSSGQGEDALMKYRAFLIAEYSVQAVNELGMCNTDVFLSHYQNILCDNRFQRMVRVTLQHGN